MKKNISLSEELTSFLKIININLLLIDDTFISNVARQAAWLLDHYTFRNHLGAFLHTLHCLAIALNHFTVLVLVKNVLFCGKQRWRKAVRHISISLLVTAGVCCIFSVDVFQRVWGLPLGYSENCRFLENNHAKFSSFGSWYIVPRMAKGSLN